MLRIHFTGNDLVRTRVADGPDPLWETVLSLQMLRVRYGTVGFGRWRRVVRDELRRVGQDGTVKQLLFPLTPDAAYFPDFLTPPEGLLGLDTGIEAVLTTPRRRIGRELRRLTFPGGPPSWAVRLALAERDLLAELGQALVAYHRAALAPYWELMTTGAELDRAFRAWHQRSGGTARLLAGFWPMMRWKPPILEIPYPVSRDVYLNGRGLVLVPSYFCWYHPIALADPSLPPTLVYPLRPTVDILAPQPAQTAKSALAKLVGPTRERILGVSGRGATTTELARQAGVSVATASQHAAVLRASGLITSRRNANAVIHTLTALGAALLGEPSAPAGTGEGPSTPAMEAGR